MYTCVRNRDIKEEKEEEEESACCKVLIYIIFTAFTSHLMSKLLSTLKLPPFKRKSSCQKLQQCFVFFYLLICHKPVLPLAVLLVDYRYRGKKYVGINFVPSLHCNNNAILKNNNEMKYETY